MTVALISVCTYTKNCVMKDRLSYYVLICESSNEDERESLANVETDIAVLNRVKEPKPVPSQYYLPL